jgi:hypothetical protein
MLLLNMERLAAGGALPPFWLSKEGRDGMTFDLRRRFLRAGGCRYGKLVDCVAL